MSFNGLRLVASVGECWYQNVEEVMDVMTITDDDDVGGGGLGGGKLITQHTDLYF